MPVASPENVERTRAFAPEMRLEGFPLLHLDFYKDDPAGLSWPRWFERQGYARTAPERGMRFRRIHGVLDSLRANAGIALCGAALIAEMLDAGELGVPYPVATGSRTAHAYVAHFRPRHTSAHTLDRFRRWLAAEAAGTQAWLAAFEADASY